MSTFALALPLYTITEAGEILRYSRSTINRLVRQGHLTKFDLGVNSVRITAESIMQFVSKRMGSQMGS